MSADRRTAFAFCLVLVLGLAGLMTWQTLIPILLPAWRLSAVEAGWLSGAAHLAYALVAPFVVAVTDRIDARRVVVLGLAGSTVAGLGLATLAGGFWSALLWKIVAGVATAATYMPGLKALTDRLEGPEPGRLQALYTAAYSLGTALSLLAAGIVAERLGWRAAFLLSGLLPATGLLILLATTRRADPPPPIGARLATFDPRPVLRDRPAVGYILGYAGHCYELFGFRTWIVALLTFAATRHGAPISASALAAIATVALLLGLPASLAGNELAQRLGRRRALLLLMPAAALLALLVGLAAALPFWPLTLLVALYAALMMADSAALTVGLVGVTPASRRGLTIGVQQLAGTSAAFVAPVVAGLCLDLVGADRPAGWAAAIASLGLGPLLGALALRGLVPRG